MIRPALTILVVLVVVVGALAMADDPGRASLTWLGWRIDTSAAAVVILMAVLTLLTVALWRIVLWIAEAPARGARARTEARRRQGLDLLTRGFLAAAAGDGAEARRCAARAADLASESPGLARILAAQAAEAAGDAAAAEAAYRDMLASPEMKLAGCRGLMQLAAARGDREAALGFARDAYDLARNARWAWRALFEARLDAGDWPAALELVDAGLGRKTLSPAVAERARAALLAAIAAGLEHAADRKERERAAEHAVRAARASPDFAPGAVIAARLLADDGRLARAEELLQQAWEAAPHPALWLAYRDVRTDETPRERAQRLQRLIDRNPGHRESRILAVEQALLARDQAALRSALAALADEPPTARLAGLFARAAWAQGRADEARAWVARGVAAAQEPDWSDLDPEGRAFAYTPADWSRLVLSWAETGVLAHPRFERRERSLTDLPELPGQYEVSAPFVAALETPGFVPDDPGAGDGDPAWQEDAGHAAGPGARPASRRRARGLGKDAGSV